MSVKKPNKDSPNLKKKKSAGENNPSNGNDENKKEKQMIGHYQLGGKLGRGYYGVVFAGLDTRTGGIVAIKQLDHRKIRKSGLPSFMKEIEFLKDLNHQNVVKYIDFIKHKEGSQQTYNFVMEYVENGSLLDLIKKFGVLSHQEGLAASYVSQVLNGLFYLQEQGVIHRDIKCGNILMTKSGKCKLADFGQARRVDDKNETEFTVAGSPYWMSPEIIQMEGASFASDIWSLGCTVVELLTGIPPYFNLKPMPALFKIVNSKSAPIPKDLSPQAQDFLKQCFFKDPSDRATAEELSKHKWCSDKNTVSMRDATKALESNPEAKLSKEKIEERDRRSKNRIHIDVLANGEQDALELQKLGDNTNHEAVIGQLKTYKEQSQKNKQLHLLEMDKLQEELRRLQEENEQLISMFQKQLTKCLGEKKRSVQIALRFKKKMEVAQSDQTESERGLLHVQKLLRRTNRFATSLQDKANVAQRRVKELQGYFLRRYTDPKKAIEKMAMAIYGDLHAKTIVKQSSQSGSIHKLSTSASWSEVFCVIKDNFFFIFSSDKDRNPSNVFMMAKRITLETLDTPLKGKNSLFRVSFDAQGQIKFATTSFSERDSWVNTIRMVSDQYSVNLTQIPEPEIRVNTL